ncbi:MAG: flagellar biosynthesis protein FlgJ [Clostridiaceae bacterium]|nr:flagellar biosynthesis protein FlgJ [Clostridiaceae bacterium]
MDIGKVDSSIMSSVIKNASSAAAQSAGDDFAKRLEAAARNSDDRELKKACQEFEALMLDMVYKQMKATIIKSELIKEELGREIFQSMLDEKLVEQASKTGSLGLADSLYKQLSRQYGRKTSIIDGDTRKSETPVEEDE